jgi:hypothetical protein
MVFTEVRTMNISYLLYQAERPRSAAEQRQADVRAGEFAAAIARAGRAGRRAVTPWRHFSMKGFGVVKTYQRGNTVKASSLSLKHGQRRHAAPRNSVTVTH